VDLEPRQGGAAARTLLPAVVLKGLSDALTRFVRESNVSIGGCFLIRFLNSVHDVNNNNTFRTITWKIAGSVMYCCYLFLNLALGVKWPKHKANPSPPSLAGIKNSGSRDS
jgi:hypothetical protein